MKASCLFLLVVVLTFQSCKRKDHQEANAVRDLLIDRVFWNPQSVEDKPGDSVNQHKFTITNTSGEQGYSQIHVRFDYYDSSYHRIGSTKYVVAKFVEPRSAVTIDKVQLGKVNPATKSATVTVEEASSN